VHFDGFKDHIAVPTLVDGQAQGTVELWFSAEDWGPNASLWSLGDGLPGVTFTNAMLGSHELVSTQALAFGTFDDDGAGGVDWRWTDSGFVPPLGVWTHVAATWSDQGRALFVDGSLVGQAATTSALPVGAVVGLLGATAWGHHFAGHIARVRISSSVRHTEGFTPARGYWPDADTLAIWHLDEGKGTTAADASGQGHDGSINERPANETTWAATCPPD
jgi:hypothetical protein